MRKPDPNNSSHCCNPLASVQSSTAISKRVYLKGHRPGRGCVGRAEPRREGQKQRSRACEAVQRAGDQCSVTGSTVLLLLERQLQPSANGRASGPAEGSAKGRSRERPLFLSEDRRESHAKV